MFNRIKELREYENYSMSQVAEKLGVAKGTYSMWEYGKDIIPLKRLVDLANIYQVKIDYLLNLSDKKDNNKIYATINEQNVSHNLITIRKNLNLSQAKIAASINLSRSAWNLYEHNIVLITTIPLYELCLKYHFSAEDILFNN